MRRIHLELVKRLNLEVDPQRRKLLGEIVHGMWAYVCFCDMQAAELESDRLARLVATHLDWYIRKPRRYLWEQARKIKSLQRSAWGSFSLDCWIGVPQFWAVCCKVWLVWLCLAIVACSKAPTFLEFKTAQIRSLVVMLEAA